MAFLQRILSLGLIPVITLVSLQLFSPNTLSELRDILSPYIGNNPLDRNVASSLPLRSETPLIVSAITSWSHYEKIAKVAVNLADLGYPITLITGRLFENETSMLHRNITFYPLLGEAGMLSDADYKTLATLPPGSVEFELFLEKAALVDGMPATHETLQQVFKEFRHTYGDDKPLLSFYDFPITGHSPILFGAPGINPDASFAMSCHPLSLDSNDTYPFHIDKVPETGPDARAIHWKAYQDRHEHYRTRELDLYWWAKLKDLGAERETYPSMLHAMNSISDHLMALGIPELNFPRSDLKDNVHFFGVLKGTKKREGKKTVAVSQGTIETNPNHLLLPTLEALKDRYDVLVIASTVTVEPEDVPDLALPSNSRAAKFVPYDLLLPLVDVLVNNGGYGAVTAALNLGIPMVVAGVGQDKYTTNNIIRWTGVGINLDGRSPGGGNIRRGVSKVLDDGAYKSKALEMSRSFERYDLGQVFDGVIQRVVGEWVTRTKNGLGKK